MLEQSIYVTKQLEHRRRSCKGSPENESENHFAFHNRENYNKIEEDGTKIKRSKTYRMIEANDFLFKKQKDPLNIEKPNYFETPETKVMTQEFSSSVKPPAEKAKSFFQEEKKKRLPTKVIRNFNLRRLTNISVKKRTTLRHKIKPKQFIIFPDDKKKYLWDAIIILYIIL